jgi:hypothetical protein
MVAKNKEHFITALKNKIEQRLEKIESRSSYCAGVFTALSSFSFLLSPVWHGHFPGLTKEYTRLQIHLWNK